MTHQRLDTEAESRAGAVTVPHPAPARPRHAPPEPSPPVRRPRGRPLRAVLIALLIVIVLVAAFVAGYLPRQARERTLAAGVHQEMTALPEVNADYATLSAGNSDLLLPGNITPLTEAVINARAEGYLRKRYVDFGDHVKAGQVLAEIEAPELDQQVQQAIASLSQTRSTLSHAQHALVQAQSNEHLSEITAQRWKTLVDRGVVSTQEFDQNEAKFEADRAAVETAQADVRAAQDAVTAAEANVDRLKAMQGFEKVTAPFNGVITARNLDIGALISSTGSTPLFRIARIDVLRIDVDVPEQSVPFIKVGEPAVLTLQEFPGRKFQGRVSRTTNALDANTRTLLTEVQVQNPDGVLLPNMYAQVTLVGARTAPAVLIPGDALVVRPDGTQVAMLVNGNHVHFQHIEVGRDYGTQIEVRSGLAAGDRVITNPNDDVREGVEVKPIMRNRPSKSGKSQPQTRVRE